MEITVAGEEIDPAELNKPEWAIIRHKQQAFHDAANAPATTPSHPGPVSSRQGTGNRPPRRQPPASPLPPTDIKIVLRPRGGLDLRSVAQASLADAVMRKAGVPVNPFDQVRIQKTSNFLLISTPSEDRANKYASVNSLTIREKSYEVVAHVSAPNNTVAGVIFNILEEDTPEQVRDSICNFNPDLRILEAKRLNTSNMAQILFDGTKVPFWIRYRSATYRCKPFRRKTEACSLCWQSGHRQDVCPTAQPSPRCPRCGTVNPPEGHLCNPLCIVCEGRHLTGSADCPRRFQPRKRLPTYAQMVSNGQDRRNATTGQSADLPDTRREAQKDASRHPARDAADSKKPSSAEQTKRKPQLPGKEATSNEHKVSYPSVSSRGSSHSPPPPIVPSSDIIKELAAIREEIALLRQENATLRKENKSLRHQIDNHSCESSSPNPPPPKRKAVSENPHPEPASPCREEHVDRQLSSIENSCKQALLEQKAEYTSFHQAIQAGLSTVQANIEALRSQMHLSISEIVSKINSTMNNPMPFTPGIEQQHDADLE